MIVIDPRHSETTEIADYHLQIKPYTDAWCTSATAATIVQEGLHDQRWLDELFAAIVDRKEGVMFAVDRYEDAWRYIQKGDGRIYAAIPEL
ncbi:hypothetical protein CH254_24165 [Rhodococcus sp. 06-412-2C]|uniref:molybdopterin-dependent oxidoreductase n=1 Tax=unclassified Rhodococcus (in: high G+C Gram-positive bacteria) TaxID=192944 RepID=UPI000B9B104B|nr:MULTISPECIES: molybdopterin-dependent oxidoreductase [unclassified Rhodococcus (in: high G+C Gram-positive bacteria)]OZC83981.1 hypothetical protein CH254_24165 [Rhodococcus sp. 06-412-2C]OZC94168.1 hypothetical protein CH279_22250 [Rhodococcus sp. 06-412-2B]